MSSSSNSTSSLSGSTSSPPDGSERTVTSTFSAQFGSMPPRVYNPDGSLMGVYDLKGNFYVHGGSRTSGVTASPTLVNASSSRAPPSRSMRNMAGGVSVSRAMNSDRGILDLPSQGSLQQQGSPQAYSMRGSSYTTAGGHSQTHVQAKSSLSSASSLNSNYTPSSSSADYPKDLHQREVMMPSQQSSKGRHSGVYFGGGSTPQYPPQPQQHAQAVSSSGISSQTGGVRSVNAAMGYDQPLQHHQSTSSYRRKPSVIGQPIRDVGSQPTQATPQSNHDPFGMLSLVSVINQTNPDVNTLALGIDLLSLGLDMTSKEDLFKTFASPWAKEPLKEGDLEFTLPLCFNAKQRPPPHEGMYRMFQLETLFYIFYSMPQDEAQLYAAAELYNRDWVYHKGCKSWFLRIGEPVVKTNDYERGTYDCFDPNKFKTVQKENMFIYYKMLEKRPSLPQHRV